MRRALAVITMGLTMSTGLGAGLVTLAAPAAAGTFSCTNPSGNNTKYFHDQHQENLFQAKHPNWICS